MRMKVEVKQDIFKRARDVPSNKMLKGVLKWTAKYKDEFMQGPLLLDGLLGAER